MWQLHKKFTEELANQAVAAGRNHLFLCMCMNPKTKTGGEQRDEDKNKTEKKIEGLTSAI